nr:putative ribonuclease H-like domain-containing protein [Tanacetum cinerariifolium]
CYLRNVVIEIAVLNILSDALPVTTNGIQLTMVFNSPMLYLLRVKMVINSPWMLSKNWLVQKQMAFGKDISNPFMADNLPKIVWFSTHQVTFMKSWLVQKQTALGKDTSNPLIVDSLLKAIWFSIHHHLTIEVLAIPGQTITDDEEDVGAEADFSILETSITVGPIPTTRVHKDHHVTQIIGDLSLASQTRSMARMVKEQALKDPSWIEAMQEKLFEFKMRKVWVLVDLPKGKRAIGSKWVFRNKKDERGIVVRNKARLVAQRHTQEEGIDYEEVFALVAWIEAIRLFLAYASFIVFMVYQMDVKSTFLYGTIEEEVYVCQPPRFEDPDYPNKVYKVIKALYGLHQAPRAWYETLANYLLDNGFQRGKIDQTLFIQKQKGDILLV